MFFRKKRKKNRNKAPLSIPAIALIVACTAGLLAGSLVLASRLDRKINETGIKTDSFQPTTEEKGYERGSIKLKNVTYDYYHSFENYLIMGTDGTGIDTPEAFSNDMADFLLLLSIDRSADTYSLLEIDRDTIAKINLVDAKGKGSATARQQICMAHAYGGTKEIGDKNTVRAVSNLLGGLSIMGYYTVDMDDIPKLNNALGGVTVTLQDDFTEQDKAMKKGATIKLTDEQAAIFLRARMSVGEGTNEERMNRQRQYLEALLEQSMQKIKENPKYYEEVIEKTNVFAETNLTNQQLSRIAKALTENEHKGIYRFEGTHKTGTVLNDGLVHMEFYPSTSSMRDILTEMFGLVKREKPTPQPAESETSTTDETLDENNEAA